MDLIQKNALRFYAWALWVSAVAWIISKLVIYSEANGGTTETWVFMCLFGVIALAPKGVQGLMLVASYQPGRNKAVPSSREVRLAFYGAAWFLLLAISGYYMLDLLP